VITPTTKALVHAILRAPVTPDEDGIRLNAAALRIGGGTGIVHVAAGNVQRARELAEAAKQADDPELLVIAYWGAATALERAGLHDEAEPLHLAIVELSADDSAALGRALLDLGVNRHLAGRLDEAEEDYRRAAKSLRGDPVSLASCLTNIGEVLLDTGRYDEAATQLREAIQSAHERSATSAWGLALLAEAEAGRGAADEARALGEEARRQLEPLSSIDPSMAHALERLERALAALTG
jgi:tetratricopeptide (TPR) repeat protein